MDKKYWLGTLLVALHVVLVVGVVLLAAVIISETGAGEAAVRWMQ